MTGTQLSWVGNESAFVDQIDIQTIGHVAVGRFGGCSRAGQTKNEDGCLIWLGDDWEFTLVLDAHDTAESASAVVRQMTRHQQEIEQTLHQPVEQAFSSLEQLLLGLVAGRSFSDDLPERTRGDGLFVPCAKRKIFVVVIGRRRAGISVPPGLEPASSVQTERTSIF